MKARVKYYDSINDIEQIELNGHDLQFGGAGDGYRYIHQTFDYIDNLTPEERQALQEASL